MVDLVFGSFVRSWFEDWFMEMVATNWNCSVRIVFVGVPTDEDAMKKLFWDDVDQRGQREKNSRYRSYVKTLRDRQFGYLKLFDDLQHDRQFLKACEDFFQFYRSHEGLDDYRRRLRDHLTGMG
jgi:hypothetical protein